MYAEIHSQNPYSESKGKTSRVFDSAPRISLKRRGESDCSSSPPWHVEITATDFEDWASEEAMQYGEYRGMERNLLLQLAPADVAQLVSFVLSRELVAFRADAAKEKR